MPDPRLLNPDFDAERARSFGYCIDKGWLTPRQVDEAKEAGRCELRADRIKESLRENESKESKAA